MVGCTLFGCTGMLHITVHISKDRENCLNSARVAQTILNPSQLINSSRLSGRSGEKAAYCGWVLQDFAAAPAAHLQLLCNKCKVLRCTSEGLRSAHSVFQMWILETTVVQHEPGFHQPNTCKLKARLSEKCLFGKALNTDCTLHLQQGQQGKQLFFKLNLEVLQSSR